MKLSMEEHWAIERENREMPAQSRERTEDLLDRIADLEDRLHVLAVLLEAALDLLERRAAEHARTLELVAAVEHIDLLVGHGAEPRHLEVAA